MNVLDALILGSLQGVTEFLPISSSGHLILMEEFLGLEVQHLKSFDVVIHIGSLLAILIYFWKDIRGLLVAFGKILVGKIDKKDESVRMVGLIVLATIPAVIAGFTLEEKIDDIFRNVSAVAALMLVVGVIFILAERSRIGQKTRELNWKSALFIGIAQAVALLPGVSRSGSTIIAAIFQGVDRVQAARFSFLMGAVAIAGAGILTSFKVAEEGLTTPVSPLVIGFISSFVLGIFTIHFLMNFLRKRSLIVFGVYLILVGGIVLITKNL